MKKETLILLATLAPLAPMDAQADYVLTQIDPPDAPATEVFGINNRGSVVAQDVGDTGGSFIYRWRTGTFYDVPPLSDSTYTSVFGINDANVMVGEIAGPHALASRAFIRTPAGQYLVFSHPDAVLNTIARGVNDGGLVTGYRDAADGSFVGFIFDPATGAFTDIVPSAFTIAQGINRAGEVVGSANLNAGDACPGTPAGSYAFVRRTDGSITFFRVNGRDTDARGINDTDVIAGDVIDPVTGDLKGFVAQVGTGPCLSVAIPDARLLAFPGYDNTIPEGIDNAGRLAGIVFNDADRLFHGFFATRQ